MIDLKVWENKTFIKEFSNERIISSLQYVECWKWWWKLNLCCLFSFHCFGFYVANKVVTNSGTSDLNIKLLHHSCICVLTFSAVHFRSWFILNRGDLFVDHFNRPSVKLRNKQWTCFKVFTLTLFELPISITVRSPWGVVTITTFCVCTFLQLCAFFLRVLVKVILILTFFPKKEFLTEFHMLVEVSLIR